jgi:hypothetical protein
MPPGLYDKVLCRNQVLGVKITVTAIRLRHRQGEHILVKECFAQDQSVNIGSRDFEVADKYEVVDETVVTFGDDGEAVVDYQSPLPDSRSGCRFGCTMEVTVAFRGTISRFLLPLQRRNCCGASHFAYPCFEYKGSDVSDEKSRMPHRHRGDKYVDGISITVDCNGHFLESIPKTSLPMYEAIGGEDYNMFKLHGKDGFPLQFRVLGSTGILSHEGMIVRVIKSLTGSREYDIKRVFTVLNDETLPEGALNDMVNELNTNDFTRPGDESPPKRKRMRESVPWAGCTE